MNQKLVPTVVTAVTVLVLGGCNRSDVIAGRFGGACVASDPLQSARWIHQYERSFPFQQEGRDPTTKQKFLSSQLYDLLAENWSCEDYERGLCALDADPWIDSNGGEELPPVEFQMAALTASKATVDMTYRFGFGPDDHMATPGQTKLKFVKDESTTCWLLDDLVGREGRSLKMLIQAYRHGA